MTIKSFLCIFIFSPMFIQAMNNTTGEGLKYTIGIKIPNDTYAHQKVNPIHMTITYLGCANEEKLHKAEELLAQINQMRPIKIIIRSTDIFGTSERPIPVKRILFENHEIEEKLIALHRTLGECEPSQVEKFDTPSWHVSLKDTKIYEEFSAKENSMLECGKLFIKPLGNFDPIAEFV